MTTLHDQGQPGFPAAVEARAQELGRDLVAAVGRYRPGLAERIEDWLLTRAVADDRFRTRLLRYMDVLASLDHDRGGHEAKRLAGEYFGEDFPDLPRPLRWLLRVGRDEHLPAPVVGETATRSAELFARRFITPPRGNAIGRTLRELSTRGRYPSFDLLGEAVLSDREARDYATDYLSLIGRLATQSAAGKLTPAGIPQLQVSVKLSSLTAHFTPVDPVGTLLRVRPALEEICHAAREAGLGVTVDLEQFEFRDLTWEIFRRTFAPGEALGDWNGAGIVVQAYLADAHEHAAEVARFAGERGTPFQVRLVKGAYWDYEVITAEANGWPPPVLRRKANTDAMFERVLGMFVDAHPTLVLAVASHNARSHAVARALAEAGSLPDGAIEHQTLFRTAEGMSRALTEMGWVARDYVPVGELLPGMAYLVRRVLENSSQAGFLLQSRSGVSVDELLRSPVHEVEPGADVQMFAAPAEFDRAPEAPWFDADHRDDFESALREALTRETPVESLSLGGTAYPAAERVALHSPSHPAGDPIGLVDLGDATTVNDAVGIARAAQADWGAMDAETRGDILRRAASLLWERRHHYAAWIVHEGGRDRGAAYAEVAEAIDFIRYYAMQAERLLRRNGTRVVPRGVVGVIPPWNFSLSIPCGMTTAALAAGNAVVLKPAEQTPLIVLRLTRLLHEAGVPERALLCVPGRGEIAGAALASHRDVSMIAFTGSRDVGTLLHRVVAEEATADGVPRALVAEMGGKNPVLVFADADLDEAVQGVISSAFGHANQRCSAASRVLVQRPIYERFRDRLVEAARSLHVGPADDPATQVNPVIDRDAFNRLTEEASAARAECRVVFDAFDVGARAGTTLNLGPLLVELPASEVPASRTGQQEIFGPILLLTAFDEHEEAYALANGTDFGLTAGVFSRSPRTVEEASQALEAGNIYVNRTITGARVGIEPFGGMWMSGTGPKAGSPDYLWAFVRRQTPAHAAATAPGGVDEQDATASAPPTGTPVEVHDLAERWEAPLIRRVEAIEGAAVILGQRRHPATEALVTAAQAARRELAVPVPTTPVAGQQGELRYDTPRGRGLVHASGSAGAHWLAAPLLAGNACLVMASPDLDDVIRALHEAGVPRDALAAGAISLERLYEMAAAAGVSFVSTDATAEIGHELYRRMGATPPGQRSLKALISAFDGPQPGEAGFSRRFAWAKAVAIRTLRHGADLALEIDDEDPSSL